MKMKKSYRALAAFLLLATLFCSLPLSAFAAHSHTEDASSTAVSGHGHDGHVHDTETEITDSDFHSHVNWESGSVTPSGSSGSSIPKTESLTGTGISGDVNADGTVNNIDAILLLRFAKNESVRVDTEALDVNGDGFVNYEDAVLLFRYVSGWDGAVIGYGYAWALQCSHVLENVPAAAASCTEDGNIEYWLCKSCGVAFDSEQCNNAVSIADVVISAYTQHKFGEWSVISAPSCTEKGLRTRECTGCGYDETTETEKTGHKVESYGLDKEPACTEAGVESGECTLCGERVERNVTALGHSAADPVDSSDTCLDRAVGTVSCARCGEVISSYGHSFVTETVYATCTEDGIITKTCSRCNRVETTAIVAEGHSEGFSVTVREATCTEAGVAAIGCLYCDYIFEDTAYETQASGHNYVITESESEYVYSCESCSDSFTKQKTDVSVYKITLVSEHGDVATEFYVQEGEKVLLPIISAEGYAFYGWYRDADLEVLFEDEYISGDVTVYAKWEAEETANSENPVLSGVSADFSFSVKSSSIADLNDLGGAVLVIDTEGNAAELKAELTADGTYKITPVANYTPGELYKVILRGDTELADYDAEELWFSVKKENVSSIMLRPGVVSISQDDIYNVTEGADGTRYVLLFEDILNVNDYFVIYEEYESNIVYIAKVYEEGSFDRYRVYRIEDVPESELTEVFVDLEVYYDGIAEIGAFVPDEEMIKNAEDELRESALFKQIQRAAAKFGILGSNGKYYYDYDHPEIKTSFKANNSKITFTFKVDIVFKRMDTATRELVDLFTVTFVVNNETTFNAVADFNLWRIITTGRFELLFKPVNKTTIGLYAKTGAKYVSDERLDLFKELFEEAAEEGKTESLDTSGATEKIKRVIGKLTVWAACVPISVELYNVFSFDMVGEIGAEVKVQLEPTIGIANYGSGLKFISNFKYYASMNAYAIAKVNVSDKLGVKLSVGFADVLGASAGIEAGPYAEAGGMLNVVVKWGTKKPLNFGASAGGYIELGATFTAYAEIDYLFGDKRWSYDKKFVLFFAGNTEMPLEFETHEQTIEKSADLTYKIYLAESIATDVVHQNLKTMEKFTKSVKVNYEIVGGPAYAKIYSDGTLVIGANAGSVEYVDLKIKVSYRTVFKIINVRVNIEHDYADEFTCHNRTCRYCRYVCVATTEHVYSEWEKVSAGACTPEPYSMRVCYDCREYEFSGIDSGSAQHHDYQRIDELSKEPTCMEDGWLTYACVREGCTSETKVEVIKSYGEHSLIWVAEADGHYEKCIIPGCGYVSARASHISLAAATCTEDEICIRCKHVIQPAFGHNYIDIPYKAPTCTEAGYYAYLECTRCHDKDGFAEIEKLGHSYSVEWKWNGFSEAVATVTCENGHSETYTVSTTVRADEKVKCTTPGKNTYTASLKLDGEWYSETMTETVAPLGHDKISIAAKEPTCTAPGWYDYEACTRCNHSTKIVRPKLSHVGGRATCTSRAVCSVCNEKYGRELDHKYESEYYANENGHYKACACGETDIVVSHTPNRTFPSETEGVVCTVCAYVITPATGHVKHTYTILVANDNQHWYVCEGCSAESGRTDHFGGVAESCEERSVCEVCGVVYGDYGEHNNVLRFNGEMHWLVCSTCYRVSGKEAHHGGIATCTKQAKCVDCGKSYGELAEHEYSSIWYYDADGHYHKCQCGDTDNHGEHVPDRDAPTENESVKCTVCAYVITPAAGHVSHSYSILVKDNDSHWYQCSVCSATTAKAAHSGGVTTCKSRAVCAVCFAEYGDEPDHGYVLMSDEASHWYECEYCDFRGVEIAHEGGTATCVAKAVCAECESEYGELTEHKYSYRYSADEHWTVCSVCQTTTESIEHSGGSATCNTLAKCTDCGAYYGGFASHTPGEDDGNCTTAIICTACGAVTTPAQATHTGGTASCDKLAECTVCGKKYGSLKAHTYGTDDADCTTEERCTVCNAIITPALEHSFGTDSELAYDERGHWRICENNGCAAADKENGTEPHTFGSWSASTLDSGKHKRECECGYVEIGDHTPEADDGDCTTERKCTVCGKVIAAAKEEHTGGTATCTKLAECTVCGKEYGNFKSHTPEEDDGDCSTERKCTVCGNTAVVGREHSFTDESELEYDESGHWKICTNLNCSATNKTGGTEAHIFGSWYTPESDNSVHRRRCECGYTEESAHTPEEDDGDCTTKIVCSACGIVTTPAKADHTGGTATCTKLAECTVCGKEYGNFKAHTPGADDGDCSTAVVCTVCGNEAVAAKSHSFIGGAEYGYDENGHWRICANDGCSVTNKASDTVPHEYGEWYIPAHDSTIHARSCVCGSVEWSSHTPELDDGNCATEVLCSVCKLTAIAAKTHDFDTEYESNETTHWHVCANEGCSKTDVKLSHYYLGWSEDESESDLHTRVCTTCGHSESAPHNFVEGPYVSDGTHHWKKCADCDAEDTSNLEKHRGSTPTCTEKAVCYTCKNEYGSVAPNNHNYELHFDSTSHYDFCTRCKDTVNAVPHTMENRVVTNVTEKESASLGVYFEYEHSFIQECTGCEYTIVIEGHVCQHESAVAYGSKLATCSEVGYKAGLKCNCGHVYFAPEEIPMVPHSKGEFREAIPSSCTVQGSKEHWICEWCLAEVDSEGNEMKAEDLVVPMADHTLLLNDGTVMSIDLDELYNLANYYTLALGCYGAPPTDEREGTASFTCSTCQSTVRGVRVIGHCVVMRYDAAEHWQECAVSGCSMDKNAEPHRFAGNECTVCGYAYVSDTSYLEFTLSEDGTSYIVTGIKDNEVTDIVIPSMFNDLPVTAIGNNAFDKCTRITSVNISEGITSIGYYAFRGCSALMSVSIPASVNEVGNYAFINCESLSRVNISDISAWCRIVFSQDYTNPLGYAHNLYLNGKLLTNLVIPEDVTNISYYAFAGCTSIESVTIHGAVELIQNTAFKGCSGITSISISVENARYTDAGNTIIDRKTNTLVLGCKYSEIPNDGSVTVIGSYAFYGCADLSYIKIPDTVTRIDIYAFYGCNGLTYFDIPDSVTDVLAYAFGECTGIIETLDNVQYVDDWAVGFEYNYGAFEAYLRSGTIGIASSAFIGADNLKFVNVPNTVKYISSQAFEGCKYLERVVFEENSGLTRIGQLAFSGCSLLNEFDIPDSVTFVGSGAFEHCDLLVEDEGEIRYVDNWVISCNSEATAAIIRDGTVGIAENAFEFAAGLKNITIPAAVKYINPAFYGCTYLKNVYYGADEESWAKIVISRGNDELLNCTIHYGSQNGACSFCGEEGMASEHKCDLCGGYVCQWDMVHDFYCEYCSKTMCVVLYYHRHCDGCQNIFPENELCMFCARCVDCCLCPFECYGCSETYDGIYRCTTCGLCNNCCECNSGCPGCERPTGTYVPCDFCGYCESCCVCVYHCEKCDLTLNIKTQCKACGLCEQCCVCGGSGSENPEDKTHPHEMKVYPHECIRSEEHFYCGECDLVFYRTSDFGHMIDYVCEYCSKGKETYCPGCNELVKEPHVKCGYCQEYRCVGDHTQCDIASRCPCGETDEFGNALSHGKCIVCNQWGCEHERCPECNDYIWCGGICKAKHCNGGPDCNEDCNKVNCTCPTGCSNYEICGLHYCQHKYECGNCGMQNITCGNIIIHTTFCEICGIPMCARDHYECEMQGKACPVCQEYGAAQKHRCEFCDGYKCDGAYMHHATCETCGMQLCKPNAHYDCRCPGCNMYGEKHEFCTHCGEYMCVGDHSKCDSQGEKYCGSCNTYVAPDRFCYSCYYCSDCCKCLMTCRECGFVETFDKFCTKCQLCYSCCKCEMSCEKCGRSLTHNDFYCQKCRGCSDCCSCTGDSVSCKHCGIVTDSYNICYTCGGCFENCCRCGKGEEFCSTCWSFRPSEEFCYNCNRCYGCCMCSYYCHNCNGRYFLTDRCSICGFCYGCCKCHETNYHCGVCDGNFASHEFCHTCGHCLKCCKCEYVQCYCKYCGGIYDKRDFCDACSRCLNCCVCNETELECGYCGNRWIRDFFCSSCARCLNCCICGVTPGVHYHPLESVMPSCETNYGYEHYSCRECRKVFYRVYKENGVFDYECEYCAYTGDNSCIHEIAYLYPTDTSKCGRSEMHYLCQHCGAYFIEEHSMTTDGLVECLACMYGDNYCASCHTVAETICYDCRLCYSCCTCEDKKDITRYCPKCRSDVMYQEGMPADCINGGMQSTYNCMGCNYIYRIEDGMHFECHDPYIPPTGHDDANGDYECDRCLKLYTNDFCAICGGENYDFHGCEEYYYQAVRAVTWHGIMLEYAQDGYVIKINVSVNEREYGKIDYYLKKEGMYDYLCIASITCDVRVLSEKSFVLEYTPTVMTVFQRNLADYVNTSYVPSFDMTNAAPSYLMFTRVSAYTGGNGDALSHECFVVGMLNLPFNVCEECHGVANVGDHGKCTVDGCGKDLCAGHVHGVCDHDFKYPVEQTECGMSFHYYCPDCNKYVVVHEMDGIIRECYSCDMCNQGTMIDIELSDDFNATEWFDASDKTLPSGDYWEPGCYYVTYVKITNNNSFYVDRRLVLEANGPLSDLADVLDVYCIYSPDQALDREMLQNSEKLGTLSEIIANGGTVGSVYFEGGETVTVAIVFQMQLSVGNEYYGATLGSSLTLTHVRY